MTPWGDRGWRDVVALVLLAASAGCSLRSARGGETVGAVHLAHLSAGVAAAEVVPAPAPLETSASDDPGAEFWVGVGVGAVVVLAVVGTVVGLAASGKLAQSDEHDSKLPDASLGRVDF